MTRDRERLVALITGCSTGLGRALRDRILSRTFGLDRLARASP